MTAKIKPFPVMVRKEIADYVRSWKFIILVALILLTTIGSLFTILSIIRDNADIINSDNSFLFLNLYTASDGNLPPFITLISFLGPLIGLALGFDVISSERNRGTMSRVIAQPIPRDYFINSKFLGALTVIFVAVFSLGFLVMGLGIISIGIPPTFDEFLRIVVFLLLTCVYIAFWLNLGIVFSTLFRQSSTSALAGLSVWLFFTVFYSMILRIIANLFNSDPTSKEMLIVNLSRISPNYLYEELTTILLTPSIRSLGALSFEQIYGTIPSSLPFSQSIMLIWPHVTGLIAASIICFGISYVLFMEQEIRA
jgi:ABC-2 type transport system permease protein